MREACADDAQRTISPISTLYKTKFRNHPTNPPVPVCPSPANKQHAAAARHSEAQCSVNIHTLDAGGNGTNTCEPTGESRVAITTHSRLLTSSRHINNRSKRTYGIPPKPARYSRRVVSDPTNVNRVYSRFAARPIVNDVCASHIVVWWHLCPAKSLLLPLRKHGEKIPITYSTNMTYDHPTVLENPKHCLMTRVVRRHIDFLNVFIKNSKS